METIWSVLFTFFGRGSGNDFPASELQGVTRLVLAGPTDHPGWDASKIDSTATVRSCVEVDVAQIGFNQKTERSHRAENIARRRTRQL